jgi:hypothetical protein
VSLHKLGTCCDDSGMVANITGDGLVPCPNTPWPSGFPCPDDEHIDLDASGFCLGCGEQT